MAKCEVCGNEYDKAFEIRRPGESEAHIFDSFECAIHALAPSCAHCSCKVVGHGIESNGDVYCCAHCARQAGVSDVKDRSTEAGHPHPARRGTESDVPENARMNPAPPQQDEVKEASEESFPASDAPAW